MISSKALKDIVAEARPIIERQLDDAEQIAAFRDLVSEQGGDWSALKALIKAQIKDERDETGEGKRVKKILEKASFSTDYADLLGWSNMNEKNFSSEAEDQFDPITGEFFNAGEILSTSAGDPILTPAAAARGSEESAASNSPETANKTTMQVNGDSAALATAAPSQSVDIPAGGDQGHEIDGSDDRCPAEPISSLPAPLAGSGGDRSIPSSNDGGAKMDERTSAHRGRTDAVSGTTYAEFEQATNNQPRSSIRPMCRNPNACGGYGRNHCHACKTAAADLEAAE